MAKEQGKRKLSRKPLTLHRHYLVDIRRFAEKLGISEEDWGKPLETKVTSSKGKKFLRIRVVQ